MANNTFEFVGKLSIGKESEKFKPYTTETYPSGWVNNKLLFNVIAGDNRHMLESKGGYFANGEGKIYSFSKAGKDNEGNEIKGEKIEIAWKNRFKPEEIANVAEFKKFVIDLEEPGRRFKLEKALEKYKDGSLEDGELENLGVEDIEKACEDSKKKRKEFIAESDFSEYLYKLISSGKINERMFKVIGNIVNQYSDNTEKFYKKYTPTRIYLAEKDAQSSSTGQLTVFFNKDSLDDSLFKKTQKYYVNGYVRDYDNQRKTNIPCPVILTIDFTNEDEKIQKVNNLFVKQFTIKDKSWKEFGVKVKILDGAQKMEITEDMLNDFQREMLELEAMTMDQIREDIMKETGGNIYGDTIREMIIINAAKGYSKGRKDTIYENQDFVITPIEIKKGEDDKNKEKEEDIFDDLDLNLE